MRPPRRPDCVSLSKATKDGAPLRRVDVPSKWPAYLNGVRSKTFILMVGGKGPSFQVTLKDRWNKLRATYFSPESFRLKSQRQRVQLLTQQDERDGEADERAGKDKRKSRQE